MTNMMTSRQYDDANVTMCLLLEGNIAHAGAAQ